MIILQWIIKKRTIKIKTLKQRSKIKRKTRKKHQKVEKRRNELVDESVELISDLNCFFIIEVSKFVAYFIAFT